VHDPVLDLDVDLVSSTRRILFEYVQYTAAVKPSCLNKWLN